MNRISFNTANTLKGVTAIAVIIHHISQITKDLNLLYLFFYIGNITVGIFFFLSGYGLAIQLSKNKNYLNGFWKNRIHRLIIPFIVTNIIFIFAAYYHGANYSLLDIVFYIVGIKLIDPFAWYIPVIFWLYFSFWISFKFFKKRIFQYAILLLLILCYIATQVLNHGAGFVSIFCFPLGILYALNVDRKLPVNQYIVASIFAIFFIFFFYQTTLIVHFNTIYALLIGILFCISFVLMIVFFVSKLDLKNKFLMFLGNISLELYLIHGIFTSTMFLDNEILATLVIIPISIFAAYLIQKIDLYIENRIFVKNNFS